MWLSQLLVNIGFSAAFPFIALFLRDHFGLADAAQRGFYMSRFYLFGNLAFAVFTPLWGVLGDRFGVKLMLYRGSFITAFLYPLMAFAPSVIAFSPDGSHWSFDSTKNTFHPLWSDAYNGLIWNPVLKCYQVFCRAIGTDRRIATVTSKANPPRNMDKKPG